MAGPAAATVLPVPITTEVEAVIRDEIRFVADQVEGNDFWVQGRPFILDLAHEDPAQANLAPYIGWKPLGSITLAAMCNDSLDHRLLGEICLHLARKFRGWIDLAGELEPDRTDLQSLPGRLVQLTYEESASYVCDADFLEAWLQCPDFHMIK